MKTAVESLHDLPAKPKKFGFHIKITNGKWNLFTGERRFRRTCLSALLLSCFDIASANPNLPQVVYGQVNIANQGKVMTITNSPNAIINWQNFSINADETTRFVQQSANSSVLNRITGQDPSRILGALQSNGRVFLINPNGILFGQGARVDVNGLVASSLAISNDDFKAGRLKFADDAGKASNAGKAGKVSNQGSIQTAQGGQVFLIAPTVENSGVITSPKGEVMLAAGHAVQLVDSANPDLHVVVSAPENRALNLGEIIAQAGKVGIFGALVNQRGSVNANSAVQGENGKILFKATRDALLEAGSVTSAINIADSAGKGGQIAVVGQRVGVTGNAQIDASGTGAGGTVLLGGDYQGQVISAALSNAQQTYVGPDVRISADATVSGAGGKVIVWADQSTQFYGSISARGGIHGGDGGLVETSGKLALDVAHARIDAAAQHGKNGKNGRWLLDPSDITITHGSDGSLSAGMFDPSVSSSIGDTEINAALNGGTDVTLQTSGGTGGTGLIRINGSGDAGGAVNILNFSGGTRSLTLNTSGAIEVRSGALISGYTGNALNVNLYSGTDSTLAGSINNFGGTTSLGSAYTLSGTLTNGNLTSSGLLTSSNGTLENMSISGTLNSSGSLFVKGDVTLANNAVVNIGNSFWYFDGSTTQNLTTTDYATLNLAGGGLLAGHNASAATVGIASGITLQGYGTVGQYSTSTIVNKGTIKANTSGETLNINPSSLTNEGKLVVAGGTMTLNPTNWSQDNVLQVDSGILNLQFNTTTANLGITARTGGTVNYSGVLDNSNATLNIGGTGQFGSGGLNNFSGTLKQGNLKSSDSTVLTASSLVLDGVSIQGTLSTANTLHIKNGLTLDSNATLNLGNTSAMYVLGSGTQHIANNGNASINLAGGGLYAGLDTGQTLQLDSGLVVQGYGAIGHYHPATIINAAKIDASSSGKSLQLSPDTLINQGSLSASAGSLDVQPTNWTNSGSILVGSSGTLNLHFNTTTAGLGTITRTGGTVNYSGTLDNTSANLDIGSSGPFGTGGLSSLAGTIVNGTVHSSDATPLAFSSNGMLDNVTLSGNLSSSGTGLIKNDLTLANGTQYNLGSGGLFFIGTGTQHIATPGTATIESAGGQLYAGYGVAGQTLQLDNGITFKGYGSIHNNQAATLLNEGTIVANIANKSLDIALGTLVNNGTLKADGGTMSLATSNWTNSGSMQVATGSILDMYLNTSTAKLGNVARSGGSVNFHGNLDNDGSTLDIGGSGPFGAGGLSTLHGTISNGTLKSGDGTALNAYFGNLDSVTLQGTMPASGSLVAKNGLTLADNAQFNLGSTLLYFDGTGQQHIGTNGSASITLDGGSLYAGHTITGQTLNIDSGITVQGHGQISNIQQATIVNAGQILANSNGNGNGKSLYINPTTLSNAANGVIKADAGGTLLLSPTNWSANIGKLQVGSSSVLDLALNTATANLGTIENSGGSVKLSGIIDNTAAVLNIGSSGAFGSGGVSEFSGTIKSGTLSGGTTVPFHGNFGTLDGVTLSGNITHSGNSLIKNNITLADGAQINVANSALHMQSTGTQHIATLGNATVALTDGAIIGGYGVAGQTLQIDSGVTVKGYGSITQSSSINLINAGTIEADYAAQGLALTATSITNSGSLRANAAILTVDGLSSNAGLIELVGAGTVNTSGKNLSNASGGQILGHGEINLGNATLTNLGQLSPGGSNAIGTLQVKGHFTQGASGALKMEVGPSASNYDRLQISANANLDGNLQVNNINGYSPAGGDQFELMSYSAAPTGSFASVTAANFTDATVDVATSGKFIFKMPGNLINIWNFDGNGDWNDASKWSYGHVPTATETAQIPDYASQFTINYTGNTQTVKSVVFLGNDKLNLSSGNLSFLQNSSFTGGGTLELSGSALLFAEGDLLLSHLFMSGNPSLSIASGKTLAVEHHTQSGGVIYGPGHFTVNQAFNRTGGVINYNIGHVNITQANGPLVTGFLQGAFPINLQANNGDIQISGDINAVGTRVSLSAPQGAIKNTGGVINTDELVAFARDGIGDNAALVTITGALQAENTGSGAIKVVNTSSGQLLLTDLLGSQGFALKNHVGPGFYIENIGQQITVNDALLSNAGNAELYAGNLLFNARSAAKIDGGDGHIVLTATGAGGIVLPSQAQLAINGANNANHQSIRLKADSMSLAGAINSGSIANQNFTQITPHTDGLPIVIEASNSGSGHLSLKPTDLGHISGGNLSISSDHGSPITINSGVNLSGVKYLWLQSDAALAVNAPVALSTSDGQVTLATGTASSTFGAAGGLQADNIVLAAKNEIDMSAAVNGSIGKSGGAVYISTDSLKLGTNGAISIGTGKAAVSSYSSGKAIDVVTSRSAGSNHLELVAAELQTIYAKNLTLGDANLESGSGALSIKTALDLTGAVDTLQLAGGCVAQANCGVVQQGVGATITVPNLEIHGTAGASLHNAVNMVDAVSFAANKGNDNYSFANGKALTLGTTGTAISGQNQRFSIAMASNSLLTIGGTVSLGSNGVLDISTDQLNLNNIITAGNLQISPATSGFAMTIGSNTCNSAPCLTVGNLHKVHTPNLILGDADHRPSSIHFAGLSVGGATFSDRSADTLRIDAFSSGNISQSGSINIPNLSLHAGGSVALSSPSNTLQNLAASAASNIAVNAATAVEVASFASAPGVAAHSGISSTNGSVSLSSDGNLSVSHAISASTSIHLTSLATVAGSANVSAPSVHLAAGNGITLTGSQAQQISSSNTQNDTVINNVGVLNVQSVSQGGSGKIQINNQGAVTVTGPVTSNTGAINIVAQSPLTVNGSVSSSGGGNITLVAGNANSPNDKLTIGSTGVVATSGAVTLKAGDAVVLVPGSSVPQVASIQAFLNGNPPPPPPTIGQCVADPTLAGCTDILPNLNTCTITPTAEGCSVVLPSLATCTVAPATAGCSAVLPSLTACTSTPSLPGCNVVLPTLATCSVNPQAPGCVAVLPTMATCLATPSAAGCSVVLPSLATCSVNPTAPGCSVVLPSLASCIATPASAGCSVVLPTLTMCSATPSLPGCSVILPTLASCIDSPATAGCSVVLPSLEVCSITPQILGCSVSLPSMATCIATPSAAGCSVVLPSLASCSVTPTAPGCSVVLPNLASCIANPTTAGCGVVLPTLTMCSATPSLPGCSVILPTLLSCIDTPATAGCSAVLPSLEVCSITPQTLGCSVSLPSMATCIVTPSATGCSVVLPSLASCSVTPTAPGCSVVLPNLASCIATPATAGCAVVLPTLTMCSAAPTLPGCSVVLPSLASCSVTPATPGCSVVLPNLAACIAAPSTAGCSVILPSLAACSVTPSAPGCSVVLPNLAACIAAPSTAGCSVILPSLAACSVTPSAPGCSVVLPNLAACIAAPSTAGCSVILPSLAACSVTPSAAGCSVVLPTLASCITTPSSAGCAVVLPTLTMCNATPTLPGCSAVLPTLASCTATPTLPGCSVVLPPINACLLNPTDAGCGAVVSKLGSQADQPLTQALNSTVNIINTGVNNSSATDTDKKAEIKEEPSIVKKDEAKKEEPVKKLYCN